MLSDKISIQERSFLFLTENAVQKKKGNSFEKRENGLGYWQARRNVEIPAGGEAVTVYSVYSLQKRNPRCFCASDLGAAVSGVPSGLAGYRLSLEFQLLCPARQ